MDSLKTLYRYWFKFGSPLPLGIFRAFMSGLIFLNLCSLIIYFNDFFGKFGYTPADLCAKWLSSNVYTIPGTDFQINRINPLYGVTNDNVVLAFYCVTTIASLFACLGLHTRISTILMAVGLVTIQHRNPMLLHGGDTLMRLGAIYVAISSSGAAFSLDRYLGVKSGRLKPELEQVSLWPQRLIQYNLALIYFTATWAKWFGSLWKSGDATWYTARLNEFDRFPVPAFFETYPAIKVATYATLFVEFALGTLIWFKPLRGYVVFAGVCLHAYIEYSMNIPFFAFPMMTCYLCFYEGEEIVAGWNRLIERFKRKSA